MEESLYTLEADTIWLKTKQEGGLTEWLRTETYTRWQVVTIKSHRRWQKDSNLRLFCLQCSLRKKTYAQWSKSLSHCINTWKFQAKQLKCLIFVCDRVWSLFHNIAGSDKNWKVSQKGLSIKQRRSEFTMRFFRSPNYPQMKTWLSKTVIQQSSQRKYRAKILANFYWSD